MMKIEASGMLRLALFSTLAGEKDIANKCKEIAQLDVFNDLNGLSKGIPFTN